jgi:hypothetical protein
MVSKHWSRRKPARPVLPPRGTTQLNNKSYTGRRLRAALHEEFGMANAVDPGPAPRASKLWLGVLGAAIVAVIVLVTAVLPAEYGIDPTGIGRALGLTSMSQSATRTFEVVDVIGGNETYREVEVPAYGEPVPLPNPAVHQDEPAPALTDTIQITLDVDQETEIKAVLAAGKMLIYSWQVDRGDIYVDFHGHDPAAGDEYWVRYKEQQEGAGNHGSLVAPFDGEHGWYWLNYNEFPVVITLTVTGYYDDLIDYGIL